VVGDLTSAFDFREPNESWQVRLPNTDDFKPVDLVRQPDQVPVPPADPRLPRQERGVRPARAIPYTLHADGHAAATSVDIEFGNSGGAAAVFQVRSTTHDPRTYTVEPGRQLRDTWDHTSGYDLSVFGPNGFFRQFTGGGEPALDVRASYADRGTEIALTIRNRSTERVSVRVSNRYGSRPVTLTLRPGETKTQRWSLDRTRGWYDLTLSSGPDEYRYAGHVENGRDSISDPGMGGLI
jgi:phospholipase C